MMISEKQLLANRQNALKSTGPRTSEGKAVSSRNALRHGFRAEQIVIMGESCDDYEQFSSELIDQLAPVGVLEARLTGQIAAALWKLQRAERMESDLLRHMQDIQKKQQQTYAQQVLAAEKRINDAKSIYHGVMQAADVNIHHVDFEDAQEAWFKTDDGRAWQENRWPAGHEHSNPMHAFDAFWAELDQKAHAPLARAAQVPADPVDPPASESEPEPQRTDLSYQVMQEYAHQKTPSQQKSENPSRSESVQRQPQQTPQNPAPISLGAAMRDDFSGSNVMLKFSRYRTQCERSFYRALNELNKLQYLRKRSEAIDVGNADARELSTER
ncbi:MAG: hypothetical protein ACYSOF_09730 [Planctomycetota bacterium]|jgi:hypothetical protein